jgi:hypothetical protein
MSLAYITVLILYGEGRSECSAACSSRFSGSKCNAACSSRFSGFDAYAHANHVPCSPRHGAVSAQRRVSIRSLSAYGTIPSSRHGSAFLVCSPTSWCGYCSFISGSIAWSRSSSCRQGTSASSAITSRRSSASTGSSTSASPTHSPIDHGPAQSTVVQPCPVRAPAIGSQHYEATATINSACPRPIPYAPYF